MMTVAVMVVIIKSVMVARVIAVMVKAQMVAILV